MIDADGSMDPGEIEGFVGLLQSGNDLVKGSRFAPGGGTADMSVLRSAGNRALLMLSNFLFGVSQTDLCYGFAAFRRESVLALDLDAVGFEIETQLFLRATRQGLAVAEFPSFESPRRFGTSNLNTFRDGWRVLMTILAERLRPVSPMAATGSRRSRLPSRSSPGFARSPRSSAITPIPLRGPSRCRVRRWRSSPSSFLDRGCRAGYGVYVTWTARYSRQKVLFGWLADVGDPDPEVRVRELGAGPRPAPRVVRRRPKRVGRDRGRRQADRLRRRPGRARRSTTARRRAGSCRRCCSCRRRPGPGCRRPT